MDEPSAIGCTETADVACPQSKHGKAPIWWRVGYPDAFKKRRVSKSPSFLAVDGCHKAIADISTVKKMVLLNL